MWQIADDGVGFVVQALNRIAAAMEQANEIEKGRIEYQRYESAEHIAQQHELMSQIRDRSNETIESRRALEKQLDEATALQRAVTSPAPTFSQPSAKTAPESPFRNLQVAWSQNEL